VLLRRVVWCGGGSGTNVSEDHAASIFGYLMVETVTIYCENQSKAASVFHGRNEVPPIVKSGSRLNYLCR
jgi:hypothetical protein